MPLTLTRRSTLRTLLASLTGSPAFADSLASFHSIAANKWRTLKIGGGGFVTAIQIASDGTKVCRTDVGGAYVCAPGQSTWAQAVNSTSMASTGLPGATTGAFHFGGVYEIVIAPSNPDIFYMYLSDNYSFGAVFKSTNKGQTWRRTNFPTVLVNANANNRWISYRIAVDPANPDIVYAGISNQVNGVSNTFTGGLYVTTNGGDTWTPLTSCGRPTDGTLGFIVAFDPTSGTTGSGTSRRTAGIYVSCAGIGVFHSKNGGLTWTLLNAPGAPTYHIGMTVDQFGILWFVNGGTQNILTWNGSAWSVALALSSFGQAHWGSSVAVDPTSTSQATSRVIVSVANCSIWISLNGGSSWVGGPNGSNSTAMFGPGSIPWFAYVGGDASAAKMVFDPSQPNTLYSACGIGVIQTNPVCVPSSSTNTAGPGFKTFVTASDVSSWLVLGQPIAAQDASGNWMIGFLTSIEGTTLVLHVTNTAPCGHGGDLQPHSDWLVFPYEPIWTPFSAGIEELVTNSIVSPWVAGSYPVLATWDRPLWVITDPDVYPSRYYPDSSILPNKFDPCWSIDWCSSDPMTLAAVIGGNDIYNGGPDVSGILTGNGTIFTEFPTHPARGAAGGIAASTPLNFVRTPVASSPYYTTDAGANWLACATGQSGTGGWGPISNHYVCADRVLSNAFYLLNDGRGSNPSDAGIYRSTNGGATWTKAYNARLWTSITSPKLRSVPGHAGHLFFSGGATDGPSGDWSKPNTGQHFYRSTNGGETWTPINFVLTVWSFGFGTAAARDGYPTIFIFGWVNYGSGYALGVHMSTDQGTSWTPLSTPFPNDSLDAVSCIEGDGNIFGRVYLGFEGTGCAYFG